MSKSLSELPFFSLVVYSPRGKCDASTKSQTFVRNLKEDRNNIIELAVNRLNEICPQRLRDYCKSATLVPCPRSSLLVKDGLWPSHRICRQMVAVGMSAVTEPLVHRTRGLRKSAFARPGERPTLAEHLASLEAHQTVFRPERILVVDDVVTRGTTLFAVALTLARMYPEAEIHGFAFVRTMGRVPEIETMFDPCFGMLRLCGKSVDRND